MSRVCAISGDVYLDNLVSAPVTAAPFSISAHCYPTTDGVNELTVIQMQDKDVDDNYWQLGIWGGDANNPARFRSVSGGAGADADVSSIITFDAWNHIGAVETSATDHRVYCNGSTGQDTNSRTPANADSVTIGRQGDSTPGDEFEGRLAEVAVWDVALTADEMNALRFGANPLKMRRANLVGYWPLFGNASPEPDYGSSKLALTLQNSPAKADNAPVALFTPSLWAASMPLIEVAAVGGIVVLRRRYEGY